MLLFSHETVSDSFRDPMDCSLPGFSVHGVSQAGILEWAAIFFSMVVFLLLENTYRSILR